MKKRMARELLKYTFDELENAINEKRGEKADKGKKMQENNLKKKNRKVLDNEKCFDTALSIDENV